MRDVTDVLVSAPCDECGNTITGNLKQMRDENEYTFPLYCVQCTSEDGLPLKSLIVRNFTSRWITEQKKEE